MQTEYGRKGEIMGGRGGSSGMGSSKAEGTKKFSFSVGNLPGTEKQWTRCNRGKQTKEEKREVARSPRLLPFFFFATN